MRPAAAAPLGLGQLSVTDGRFLVYVGTFIALLWAAMASGAFFHLPLVVFLALSLLAGMVALARRRRWASVRWWALTVAPMAAAVVVAAEANRALADAPYALIPVVAAMAFGLVGSSAQGIDERWMLLGIVVEVTTVLAVLSWLGVALHWTRFATLDPEGWRASATIGYANVTGMVLLIGLVCAAGRAAKFARPSDDLRCWALATGVLATQSRSAAIALGLCLVVLWLLWRPTAKALLWSVAWAVVALAGLVPSIRDHGPQLAPAVIACGLSAAALVLVRRPRTSLRIRAGLAVVPAVACLGAMVALRRRISGEASVVDRLHIWHQALSGVLSGSIFGQGPRQLADLSRGHLGPLLTHNDPLQYAKYYGVLGLAALAFAIVRLGAAAVPGPRGAAPDLWAVAVAVCVGVAAVALVDFPLQVPIVPALVSLVVGASLQPGGTRKDGHEPEPI
ncbi:MAG: O-antigen ligase family protein [Acidimicrobiales bacterium]